MTWRALVALLAGAICIPSCATMQTETTYRERVIRTELVRTASGKRVLSGVVTTDDEGIRVTVKSTDSCTVRKQQVLSRTRVDERRLDPTDFYTEIGVGAVGLISGLAIAIDARNVPAGSDRLQENPVGRTGAYIIGAGLIGVGIAGTVAAILHKRSERRAESPAGEKRVGVEETPTTEPCDGKPAAGTGISLLANLPDGTERGFGLGLTAANGQLLVPWSRIPEELLVGDDWTRSGAVALSVDSRRIGIVDLALARGRLARAAWAKIPAGSDWKAYRSFHRRFRGQRQGELKAAFDKLRLKAIKRSIAVALIAKKLEQIKPWIDEWRRFDPESPRLREVTKLYLRAKAHKDASARWAALASATRKARRGDLSAAVEGTRLLARLTAQLGVNHRRIIRRRRDLHRATSSAVRRTAHEAMRAARRGRFVEAKQLIDAAAALRPKDRNLARAIRTVALRKKSAARREARRTAKLPAVAGSATLQLRPHAASGTSVAVAFDVTVRRRLAKATLSTEATCKVDTWEFRSASSRRVDAAVAGQVLPLRTILFQKPALHQRPIWCDVRVDLTAAAVPASLIGQFCWRAGKLARGRCK